MPGISLRQKTDAKDPSSQNGEQNSNGNGSSMHARSTREALEAEQEFAAHNYHPLPVVIARGEKCYVWDPEGKRYLDFLSAYSAVNQGHCHPELVATAVKQMSRLTLTSRAFHNDVFPRYAQFITTLFGYESVLPMNTGAEAVETAIKLARKWGYKFKGIPPGQALVLSAEGNFHGRTFGAISLSADPESRDNYEPLVGMVGHRNPETGEPIRYNNSEDLRRVLESVHGKNVAGFVVEPIQGEGGIIVPKESYFCEVAELCRKHNVLLICDEVQTGIGRTGKMLCSEWSGIKPDVITLGKALSGGMYPVSAVLCSKQIMYSIEPGTHGSTFGGNPLGCALAIRALELIQEENMLENSVRMGEILRSELRKIDSPAIKEIRGKGLMNAIELNEKAIPGYTAWDLCMTLRSKGLLTKPTKANIIRLSPPLVISETQIRDAVDIFRQALRELSESSVTSAALGIPDRRDL